MQKESSPTTAVQTDTCPEDDVVLNLTISGAREQILRLLEQMGAVPGFSVVKGSFIVCKSGGVFKI